MCHLWGDLFPENYRSNCIKRKPNNLVVWTPALVNTKFGNLGTCKPHDAYTTFLWVLPTFPNSEVFLPQKFHLSFSEVSLLESFKKNHLYFLPTHTPWLWPPIPPRNHYAHPYISCRIFSTALGLLSCLLYSKKFSVVPEGYIFLTDWWVNSGWGTWFYYCTGKKEKKTEKQNKTKTNKNPTSFIPVNYFPLIFQQLEWESCTSQDPRKHKTKAWKWTAPEKCISLKACI